MAIDREGRGIGLGAIGVDPATAEHARRIDRELSATTGQDTAFKHEDRARMAAQYRRWQLVNAAQAGALFALRWGLAVILLGAVVRVTLTEILVPPIFRLVREDLAITQRQSAAGAQAAAYLELAVQRGVLPNVANLSKLPDKKAEEPAK
jgi:hypothetical protein